VEPSFIKIFLFIIIIYAVAPTAVIRLVGIGAVSRAPRGRGRVVLTFDDGPDPRYTPQILDILRQYQVKASFFVVGYKAREHPELLRRIAGEGHEIGNHGYKHRIMWLLGPGSTIREIMETNHAIEECTGQKPCYCRPGWGLFTLFSIWYCWLKNQKVVLWTFMSWDWIKKATPDSITRKVLGRVKDGSILLLHDSDSTPFTAEGCTSQVVAALPSILDGLEERGLKVTPLREIAPLQTRKLTFKRLVQRIWSIVDRLIRKISGIKELESGRSAFYYVALRCYRGKDWTMPDGSLLRPGDLFLELHVNNDRLLGLINENMPVERTAIIAMREVRQCLPVVARMLNSGERFSGVKALFGITLLHRGLDRLGFTAYEMKPGIVKTIVGLYEHWLLGLYHPGGFKKLNTYREKLTPKYVIMTREELMRRYLNAPKPSEPPMSCVQADDSLKDVL